MGHDSWYPEVGDSGFYIGHANNNAVSPWTALSCQQLLYSTGPSSETLEGMR
jgi:hypothetical protein